MKPLPWEVCRRVDSFLDVGEELADHLLVLANTHDCSYALVELKRFRTLVECSIKHIEEQQEDIA